MVTFRSDVKQKRKSQCLHWFFVGYCEAFKYGVWFQNFIVTSKFCFIRRFIFVAINVKSCISICEFL